MSATHRTLLLVSAVTVTACMGNIGDPRGGEEGFGAGSGSGPGSGAGTGGGGGGAEASCAGVTTVTAAESPVRRLTREEYGNTVRDLLGVSTATIGGFLTDEKIAGFDSNSVAPATELAVEQYQQAAASLAQTVSLERIVPCDPATDGEGPCAAEAVGLFGARAFRRQLLGDERERLLAVYAVGAEMDGFEGGIRLVVEAALQSPHFLYRVEAGLGSTGAGSGSGDPGVALLTPYELASRLSYFLWRSMPDEELFAAAESGELSSPAVLEAEARRLLTDPRAERTVDSFFRQWLELDDLDRLEKDQDVHADFTPALRDAMWEETSSFARHVVLEGDRRFDTLLTAPFSFVSSPLASLYEVEGATGDAPVRVELDPSRRAGVLTHASVLARHAKPDQSSPILRGKLIRERVLCQQLPAPPDDVDVSPPALDSSLTTRERFARHTADPSCAGCHQLIDPVGFGFEAYDGIGRFRDAEGDLAVDTRGEIISGGDVEGPFDGAGELAHRLAASDIARDCFARQWFRYAMARDAGREDLCSFESIRAEFERSGGDVRELMVAIVLSDAFRYRRLPTDGDTTGGSL